MVLLSARERMLRRAAADIEPGMTVNLGIGLPTKVMDYVPKDMPVLLHSENGVVGVGEQVGHDRADRNLIDAGGGYVSLARGAAFMDSATSFSLVRKGRLDLTLLGAFEISSEGDLANWVIPGRFAAGVGGAIELAQKARRVGVVTSHTDKHGNPKILENCTLPLTATRCVNRIYSDMAVCDVIEGQIHVVEIADGLDPVDLQAATGAPLVFPETELPTF